MRKPHFLKYISLLSVLMTILPVAAFADVYINVMAVNGAPIHKDTDVKFNLPGDLTAGDVLDTDGLTLDYNPNYANYIVTGKVALDPKASKTFKIRVRDIWKISQQEIDSIKNQIDDGYEKIGKTINATNAELLKTKLNTKLDYIYTLQASNADSIDRRIAAYRMYKMEVKRIQNSASSVDYWRSDPGKPDNPRVVHVNVTVENPTATPQKNVKEKQYLPAEVKPEHVIEPDGFEVRFDQAKQLSFLYKEEQLEAGDKKKYTIGILDLWLVSQTEIDYLRKRTEYANGYLKSSKYASTAKTLVDRITTGLDSIEKSQTQSLPILDHISAYRENVKTKDDVQNDVEELEKLLALYREDLEKSKVQNVLNKVKGLKSVQDVSNAVFKKPLEQNNAWKYIGWVVLFVGLLTLANFVMWMIRSKDKKITDDKSKGNV